jgi:hypothetical protein
MDQQGFDYVFNERIQGGEDDKNKLKEVVIKSSKYRKLQADRMRKISFRDYLGSFGVKLS